jgi:hypothetical protein
MIGDRIEGREHKILLCGAREERKSHHRRRMRSFLRADSTDRHVLPQGDRMGRWALKSRGCTGPPKAAPVDQVGISAVTFLHHVPALSEQAAPFTGLSVSFALFEGADDTFKSTSAKYRAWPAHFQLPD